MAFGQFLGVQQVGDPELVAVGTAGAGGDVQHALGIGDPLRLLARRAHLGGSLIPPEKLGGLIEQRDVRGAPGAGFVQQRGTLRRGQAGCRGGEPRRAGEQLFQQALRREDGPQVIELGTYVQAGPQLAPYVSELKLLVVAAAGDLRDGCEVGLGRLGEDVGYVGLKLPGEFAGDSAVPLGERGDDLPLKDCPALLCGSRVARACLVASATTW
jgi:hypothetical protein